MTKQEIDEKLDALSEMLQDGKNDEVLQETKELLASLPSELKEYQEVLWVIMARVFYNKGDLKTSASYYKEAAESPEGNKSDWLQLTAVYAEMGDGTEAMATLKHFSSMVTQGESLSATLSLMAFCADKEKFDIAETLLNNLRNFYLSFAVRDLTHMAASLGDIPPAFEDFLDQAIPILNHMAPEKRVAWIADVKNKLPEDERSLLNVLSA